MRMSICYMRNCSKNSCTSKLQKLRGPFSRNCGAHSDLRNEQLLQKCPEKTQFAQLFLAQFPITSKASVLLALMAMLLSGCGHYYTTISKSGVSIGRRGGIYYIASAPSPVRQELLRMSSSSQMFLDSPQKDAIRVDIEESAARHRGLGFSDYANNLFSLLTLGLIPWHSGDKAALEFSVKGDGFERRVTAKAGYVMRCGHLPLPALGVTDILLVAGGTVVGCVSAVITNEYYLALLGLVLPFTDDGRDGAASASADNHLKGNINYEKLAKLIADSLKKSDYNAAMRKKQKRIKFLPASVVADYAEMDGKSARLRQFALKKMPSLWKRFQSLRAALDVQEEKVVQARERLDRMGRTPEQDSGYIRLCEERYRMALLLRELFVEIDKAYLDSTIYEDSLGDKGLKKFEEEQQEGVDDARMLRKRYERYK